MRLAGRVLALATVMTALSSVASAYYYWTFFPSHNGPFVPVRARYDLTQLTSNTVSFFISDQGPSGYVPGDSFPALISQIRAAAEVWNSVATSGVRVKFGGISTVGSPQSTPGIDVTFDDNIPQGLVALTRLTLPNDLSGVAAGSEAFVPIQRATIQFYKNLNAANQPSYNDFIFTTMVHEFGHALGLQHTLTSSVMSTGPTRGTSKAQPLGADDIAGISLLYPVANWLATTGTIQGHVLLASSGVNMASVVALSTNGVVVSTLSNPDGSYQIAGLPPGQYYVYAHPLPPAQQGEATPNNINPPVDAQQNAFPANIQFDTEFYGGTRDWTQSTVLSVGPGALLDGINFSMQKRNGPAIYGVTTYGYEGPVGNQVAVPEPPLPVGSRTNVVFSGPGMATGGQVTPTLNITAIGSSALAEPGTLRYYLNSGGYDYLYMTIDALAQQSPPAPTPVALAMTTQNDLFVLPQALNVVASGPPAVTSAVGSTDSQGNTTAVISGANLSGSTRIVFDGAPAAIENVNGDGSLTVVVPPALSSYNAVVTALGSDGQSSTQAVGPGVPPPVYFSYAPHDASFIAVNNPSPAVLQAGTDTLVDISGFKVNFVDGQVVVGFGSSDVVVKKVWVTNRGFLRMNVSVAPAAQAGPVTLTVISGLQLMTLASTVQVQAYNARTATLLTPVTNFETGLAGVPAGQTAVIGTSGLSSNLSGWTLLIGGASTNFKVGANNQLLAQVPPGASLGPAVVQLVSPSGDTSIPPILMEIDGPPPTIAAVLNSSGQTIDATHPAQAGDTITINVIGLADTLVQSQLRVTVGGVPQTVMSVTTSGQSGSFTVTFLLSSLTPAGSQQVTVGIDTNVSAGVSMVIRPSDNSSQQGRK
jgi:hypothetical protein